MWLLLGCVAGPAPVETGVDSGDGGADSGDSGADSADSGVDSGDSGADTGDSGADTGDSGVDTGDADGLVGVVVDPPRAPPVFSVIDQAGEARTEAWLTGHPTVLWFFREAEGST